VLNLEVASDGKAIFRTFLPANSEVRCVLKAAEVNHMLPPGNEILNIS
jgi:hypothetical protein